MFPTIAAVVFVVAFVVIMTATLGKKPKNSSDDLNDEMRRFQQRVEQEKREWLNKVKRARHLLEGKNWRSSEGKEAFVTSVFSGRMPKYLFYALGDNAPSEEEGSRLLQLFWPNFAVSFGDFELHQSGYPQVGIMLRIRSPEVFAEEIVVNGQACPLYQVGHSMFGDTEPGCVNFIKLLPEKATV